MTYTFNGIDDEGPYNEKDSYAVRDLSWCPKDAPNFTLHAHGLACSLAFAIKDMPRHSEMRKLAIERLEDYIEAHDMDGHAGNSSAKFLLQWAGLTGREEDK